MLWFFIIKSFVCQIVDVCTLQQWREQCCIHIEVVHRECNCKAVNICTSCSSQQNLWLCIRASLYNIYSSQNFFSSCIREIFHLNNDLRTINTFPDQLNTVVLLNWCLGLSNLHVKQECFYSGTWTKSFAHEVKMTFPQKETNKRKKWF